MGLKANEENKILIECWTRAFQEGRLQLPFSSKHEAGQVRLSLYRVARKVRKGQDPDLIEVVDSCSISWNGPELIIYRRELPETLKSLSSALPKPDLSDSIARAKELLGNEEGRGEVSSERATPYYERD